MSTRPAGAVPIAPSRAPAGAGDPARPRAVAHSDIVFANGQAFNGRGYRVCGVANQRGTLCGRIGTCPFHAGQTPGLPAARVPKRRRSRAEPDAGGVGSGGGDPAAKAARVDGGGASAGAAAAAGSAASASTLPECVRRLDTPPAKMRFKRSWTPDEHRQFLASMKKFGKGKWKEIAREVGTRTANQCQSHAQKYFLRQAKSDKERKKKSIHDLTDEPPPTAAPAPGKAGAAGGAALPVMLPVSALQGSFSQLMANPQAMMMLNPLLASMSAANAAVGGPAAAAVAPPPPPPPPARLRVTVHKNGFKGGGMALMLPDSMPEFFALAKSKLVFDGVFHRVFTRSGGEITSLDQMVQDDALWLSRGEEFATPT